MTIEHPRLAELNDLVDGTLANDAARVVSAHVETCVACRRQLTRLRTIVQSASALPPSIEPPRGTWVAVARRIEVAPSVGTRRYAPARRWLVGAAAALILVAASSLLTTVALRSRDAVPRSGAASQASVDDRSSPAILQNVDRSYADVADELTATLRTQRDAMSPPTRATLERTLRLLDEAIAEARSALARDPQNAVLVELLSSRYEHKLQLLRRATELPART